VREWPVQYVSTSIVEELLGDESFVVAFTGRLLANLGVEIVWQGIAGATSTGRCVVLDLTDGTGGTGRIRKRGVSVLGTDSDIGQDPGIIEPEQKETRRPGGGVVDMIGGAKKG
jgi:hypothetical protein